MALKQVKNKIVSTLKTGKVTKAMEAVSAVKMRKSQEKAFLGRPYVHSAMRILAQIAQTQDVKQDPLASKASGGKKLVVIVTSDKGLAGSVNSAVLKKVDDMKSKAQTFDVITIGRKAHEYALRENLTIVSEYTNLGDDVTISDVHQMAGLALSEFKGKKYQSVEVVYQNFISTFEQEPTVRKILPIEPEEIRSIMLGIRPKKGKFSNELAPVEKKIVYTIEPNAEEVYETLIPQLIQILFYHALLENKACEHSARMVAMKNATDKSKEVAKALTLVYNKERQSAITAEVSEITGGMEALKT